MTVGERIIQLCSERGIPVMSLEQKCGLSSAYIKNIAKKGSIPGAERLKRIAEFLDVPAEYILTGSTPKQSHGPVFVFSDEEKQLVLAYRKLLQPQKDLVLQMLNIERKKGRSSTSEAIA